MQEKNLLRFFGAYRKVRLSGSLFGITRRSLVMPAATRGTDYSVCTYTPSKILIIFYGAEVHTEKSVPRVAVGITRLCLVMPNRIPRKEVYCMHRKSHNRFFLLHTHSPTPLSANTSRCIFTHICFLKVSN